MKTLFAITLLCFAAFGAERAMAQGFSDEPTCYSWEGGSKSAGSFTKCPQPWVVAKAPPAPVAAPAVVAAPVLSSNVCPPQIILQPEPNKPKAKKRPAPKPLKC